MLASGFLRHPQTRSAWRPVDAWCRKGAVFAEVGLRPDRLTDAEDRALARLRALRTGLALSCNEC